MIRKIIHINTEKCNGCGICVNACHEGAIGLKDGKAVLLREDYCDGLGDCLPACPMDAITFTTREAAAYDHAAVQKHLENRRAQFQDKASRSQAGEGQSAKTAEQSQIAPAMGDAAGNAQPQAVPTQLKTWPVQLKLLPVASPIFQDAHILIAADCTAYAYGDFHSRFMKNRIPVIACPKLDAVDYSEKLEALFSRNSIQSVTVTRMEVPCCGGIAYAVKEALERVKESAGISIPLTVVTISTEGDILSTESE